MKRKPRIIWMILGTVLLCSFPGGCALGQMLDEIPREFSLLTTASEDMTQESQRVLLPEAGGEILQEVSALGATVGESFLMQEVFPYACGGLSRAEQVWYHDMERILGNFGEGMELSAEGLAAGMDESNIDRIFQCVMADHPELFYVEGYSYLKYTKGNRLISIEFSGTYSMDRETAEGRREEILAAAEEILAGVEKDASDYDKVKYVYDTLICNTDYSLDAPDNQNIYSVFVNHLSVCQGYAKATQYLLNRLGVECTLVLGHVDTGEGHAWNLVKVDGEYYYVDTTWGDVSYQTEGVPPVLPSGPAINYDYLNVTTEEILRTHSIGGEGPMPQCVATEANYYVREGALFSSYDRDQMAELFRRKIQEGQEAVTVKCTDAVCYGEVLDALVGKQEIFSYLPDREGSIAYAQNEKQLSVTFWVTKE